jgi:hypothetical protein
MHASAYSCAYKFGKTRIELESHLRLSETRLKVKCCVHLLNVEYGVISTGSAVNTELSNQLEGMNESETAPIITHIMNRSVASEECLLMTHDNIGSASILPGRFT